MGNTCNTCNCDGKNEAQPNEFNVEDQFKNMKAYNKGSGAGYTEDTKAYINP